MTEVENCEGRHRTRLRQILCLWGAPSPVYKGGEEEAGQQGVRQGEGIPTRTPVLAGFGPTLFSFYQRGKGEGEGVGEGKGVAPPSQVQFGLLPCGGRTNPLWAG